MKTNQRYILLTFLAIAVAVGFSARGLAGPILAWAEYADPNILGVFQGSGLVGFVLGVLSFVGMMRSRETVQFTDEVVTELRRVTWPDREESFRSAGIVVGTSLFLALTLAGFDWLWGSITSAFLFTEG